MLEQDEAITGSVKPTSLRVLFVGKAHLSHVGGAEMSTRYLAAALANRGNDVSLLASVKRRSIRGLFDQALVSTTGRILEHAVSEAGCATVSSIRPLRTLRSAVQGAPPDVVVVTGTDPDFAVAALRECADRPTILYVRVDAAIPVARDAPVDLVVTNSAFMAGQIAALGVKATFLPSVFPPSDTSSHPRRRRSSSSTRSRRRASTSPSTSPSIVPTSHSCSASVGGSNAAALRSLRTRGSKAWEHRDPKGDARSDSGCSATAACCSYRASGRSRGARVVSEAQISGIPTVASRVGGLPESVGPGGILVTPRTPSVAWLEALSEVWDDQDRYARLCRSVRSSTAVGPRCPSIS